MRCSSFEFCVPGFGKIGDKADVLRGEWFSNLPRDRLFQFVPQSIGVRNLAPQNVARLKAIKAGASRTSLPKALRPDCHKNNSGFSNVYGRMSWDKPSPTITGGCTTLSKGRFGHPSALRTISVREAAALQSFPDDYIFDTEFIDRACIMIGNALPPKFAKIMADVCVINLKEARK